MKVYDLFNTTATARAPTPRAPISPAAAGGEGQPVTTGAFITAQSLVSFPLAAGLVAGFWKMAQVLVPDFGASKWMAVAIAFAIGLVIYLISVTDERLNLSGRAKAVALVIAIINCLYLAMAALGINPS